MTYIHVAFRNITSSQSGHKADLLYDDQYGGSFSAKTLKIKYRISNIEKWLSGVL